jgi:hypothetical protein
MRGPRIRSNEAATARALRAAVVRMPDRKSVWLAANFERIQTDGGPAAIKRTLEAQPGRDAKIGYLRSFHGIGDKYARDMMMQANHPEFRDSIAVDVRVTKVSDAFDVKFATYDEAEGFFLAVAARAGFNGWELAHIPQTGVVDQPFLDTRRGNHYG